MKIHTALFFLMFIALSAVSQDSDETANMYILAIEKDLELYDKFISEGIGIIKPKKIVVQKNKFIKKYPKQIQGLFVSELNTKNAKKLFRENKKSLSYILFEPIKIQEDTLIITITKISGKLKNRKYILSYGNWTDVYFQYNCQLKKWEYYKSEIRGI